MHKIPTMFERDENAPGHPVKNAIKQECRWVADGDGYASRKLDGMNVKIEGGVLFKRRKPLRGDYDEASYVRCSRDDPADKYLFQAFDHTEYGDGVYEAIGPKIQGNPEHQTTHFLVCITPPETALRLIDPPRDFDGLRDWLADPEHDVEGVVWHHQDGRMAKIKKRDFGIRRGNR